ncbi:CHAT domain-containing protein [Olleya namhaensis]|uniref:CHAT domain-containing protein n=1 Tax=Olleya namhaensis TaxID=1144750 RepID=A0A1I3KP30_9FLAO|nr:CHAT domain-containing tetratricopeptide repeat protein [Olleya namhaensis]SFI74273.1 CHAT domain-containing protein [Olleya namhaensis]
MKLLLSLILLYFSFTSIEIKKNNEDCNKSRLLAHKKQYQEAINNTLQACDLSQIDNLNFIAKCYNNLNDYYKEIDYLERVIYINKRNKKHENLVLNYLDIAKAHRKLNTKKNITKSIDFLKEALHIDKNFILTNKIKYSIYNNIGNYYKALSNFDYAIQYYKKAIIIARKLNDSKKTSRTYSNLSTININVKASSKQLKIAQSNINKALSYDSISFPDIYANLGIVNYLLKDYKTAIKNHNRAIEILTEAQNGDILNLNDVKNCKNKKLLLNTLFEKIYALIKLKDKKYLTEGLNIIKLADKVFDLLLIETKTEKTKLHWRKRAYHFYYLGIHISHELNDIESAFYFSEKSKTLLLLNEITYNSKPILPDSINTREINLKKTIYSLENQINILTNEALLKAKNDLFETQVSLKLLTDSLEASYPIYKNSKNNLDKTILLRELQNSIKTKNTCIISYLWDKTENQFNALYGIAITQDQAILFKINNLNLFDKKVTDFKKHITSPISNVRQKTEFENIAKSLYNDLFPEEIAPLIANNKLLIIPDSDLQSIPFEALRTKNNDYLIKNHEISYAYSVTHLLKNNTIKRDPKNTFISFAPITFNYDNLKNLPQSKAEAKTIANLFSGKSKINQNATKNIFLKNLNDYKIIHLSTHSDTNDSITPWIAFKNKKLQLNELYTTTNQAELVFLSSCKSSLGQSNQGEGIFSLARGFFSSGANSVISSLWNVNDKSNAEITLSFYKYIKKGKSKSTALRQAKLDYIKTYSLSEVSPYYWSSLTLIGDDSAIEIQKNTQFYIIIIVLLMCLIFIILKTLKYYKIKIKI